MAWPTDSPPDSLLQPGIYLEAGVPPPPSWRSLFLDVRPGADPQDAHKAIGAVMAMLAALQAGRTRDLGAASNPPGGFAAMLGYGTSFFDADRHQPALTGSERPAHLSCLRRDGPAFPAIPWADDSDQAPLLACSGEADLLLQFTGLSDHAVSRAAVEVSHLIRDDALPLVITGTLDGFLRDDGRSWIGFHDGVSNVEPSERPSVVTCPGDPDWNRGGTYLALLRLQLDLDTWRALSRTDQELIVGRDKLTGWPIGSVSLDDGQLRPVPLSTEPVTTSTHWRMRDAYFNPPDTASAVLEASHTHRSNQNKGSGVTRAAHRIFRQGYEYLDSIGPEGTCLGLNFVSFQSDLQHVQQILGLKGWLGDANFGGRAGGADGTGPRSVALATLCAGGFYAVPPRDVPFPGARLFGP